MGAQPAVGRRWSVRGASTLVVALLSGSAMAVVGGLLWTATLLQDTSSDLIRHTASMELASEIQLRLLSYQRMANVALVTDEREARDARDRAEREMHALLGRAGAYATEPVEVDQLEDVTAKMEAYLRARRAFEREGFELPGVLRRSRAELNEAVAGLESLRRRNQREVEIAHARARRVGTFFRAAAGVAAAVGLMALLMLSVGVRHWILRPILDIRATIERLREGDRDARAREEGPRELCEIAVAFNEMSEKLARQQEEQLAFVAGVAHDLRNPLAALKLGVKALGSPDVPEERRKRSLSVLDRQLEHLTRMLGDLIDSSQIEAGKLELELAVFDLRDAARAMTMLYGPVSPIHALHVELADGPVLVRADRVRIEQVIGNLLSNAIKYSAGGGSITISAAVEGREAVLSVTDQGPGIPSEDFETIFRPFRRRSILRSFGPGSGLGLANVRRIVDAHDGRIQVESTPGTGSTFRVRLPLAE